MLGDTSFIQKIHLIRATCLVYGFVGSVLDHETSARIALDVPKLTLIVCTKKWKINKIVTHGPSHPYRFHSPAAPPLSSRH